MNRKVFIANVSRLEAKYGCKLKIELEEQFKIIDGEVAIETIFVKWVEAEKNETITINGEYDSYTGIIAALDKKMPKRTRNLFNKDMYEIIAAFMVDNDTKVFDQTTGRYNIVVQWNELFSDYSDCCADIEYDWLEVTTNFDHDELVAAIERIRDEREEADKIRMYTEDQLRKTA